MAEHVLVGDVGGTNVRFGIAHLKGETIGVEGFQKLAGNDFADFEESLSKYISLSGLNTENLPAVFAVAGPVANGFVTLTNREWTISEQGLKTEFGLSSVRLANDFTAMARAVPEIDPKTFIEVKSGVAKPNTPVIVAGPGTGFGVATLMHVPNGRWHVIGGEGGYMSYSPETSIEHDLAQRLRTTHGYVSTELVCAGIGLESVHRALCEIYGRDHEYMNPSDMLKLAASGDEMFLEQCRIRARGTMRAVGDLVLVNGGLGGVILAGGVSAHLIDFLQTSDAIDAFSERGRNSHYLEKCPIHLMRNPIAPLIGAAALALKDDQQ